MNVGAFVVFFGEVPFPHNGQCLSGERLVEFDDVHVRQFQTGLLQRSLGCWNRADAHGPRWYTSNTPADQAHEWTQAKFFSVFWGRDDNHRGGVVLTTGVASGNGCLFVLRLQNWLELAQGFHRGVRARMLVGVNEAFFFTRLDLDRDDLFGHHTGFLCGNGALVRLNGQLVLFFAADRVFPTQVLGGFEHATRDRVVLSTGGAAGTSQRIVHLHAGACATPPHIGRVEGRVAHAFGATCNNQILGTSLDRQDRKSTRLNSSHVAISYAV